MVIGQGDVCWVSLEDPIGSRPAFRRPVVVVQGNEFNASRISTTVVVPLTSNPRLAAAPGNVLLDVTSTNLPKDSVANVSLLTSIDRTVLNQRVGRLSGTDLELILRGISLVLGRA